MALDQLSNIIRYTNYSWQRRSETSHNLAGQLRSTVNNTDRRSWKTFETMTGDVTDTFRNTSPAVSQTASVC